MLKNYFKIAFRNIFKNKTRSLIHVLGLSIGVSICLLIFNILWYSYSFDNFHPKAENIYRVTTVTDFGGGEVYPNSGTPVPLGEVVDQEISGVDAKARFYTTYQAKVVVQSPEKDFGRTNNVILATPGFFEIFKREWIAGDPTTSLQEPYKVVLTESSARKYFPGLEMNEVLGKEILYTETDTMFTEVSGVVKDYTENTDFIFTDFISFSTISVSANKNRYAFENWDNVNSSSQLYIRTVDGIEESSINKGLAEIVSKNLSDQEDAETTFKAEPLSAVHFGQTYDDNSVSKTFLNGLLVIGIIILILACLNFVNLETAQAIGRAKEVGIRKTLGGNKSQLIFQFLTETYLIVLSATILSFLLVEVLIASFDSYLPKGIVFDFLTTENVLFTFGFTFILTVFSGIYPALILVSYQPQRALKGEVKQSNKFSLGVFLRKNLTVLQFASSISFIILVSVISYQLKYVSSQPLGFNSKAILYSSLPYRGDSDKFELLRDRLNQLSYVKRASLSGDLVSSTSLWTSDAQYQLDTAELDFFVQIKNMDSAFVEVNGLELLAGRTSQNREDEVLVNEVFMKQVFVNRPEELVGQKMKFSGEEKTIVGVVKNYHSRTLREEIRPILMVYQPEVFRSINVKLQDNINLAEAKLGLEKVYKEVIASENQTFKFLDDEIGRFYEEDLKIRNVLGLACGLAILISCLGLFGLSSFTIAQRTKEISIRKVLGATILQILGLISKDYVLLVLVSFVLAIYPAYYFLNDWLNGFQYRVEMPYFLFAISGLGVMIVCLIIVGLHSFVAAQSNPAKVLKDE
ncbi:ABC transporter permease [Algoriphagus pacificus]|uniref:ABC transporter permease n=1 Tax=Algoriphagus pacificus TaxID=2811234 RepID=A0ABS3CKP1_9BACT|nr:ABC transporter permease [Algoriphagus pacificus]MBN7817320.1 ABC transporter permease [Algoriphagus pacificus]